MDTDARSFGVDSKMAFWMDDWERIEFEDLTPKQLMEVVQLILEELKVNDILKHRYDKHLMLHKFDTDAE